MRSSRSPLARPCSAETGRGSPRPREWNSASSGSWDSESTLLATTSTGRVARRSLRAKASSSAVIPAVASTTRSNERSASSAARAAWRVTSASIPTGRIDDPAGVHQHERAGRSIPPAPRAGPGSPRATRGRWPRRRPTQPVDQRGLAHVRPADHGHPRKPGPSRSCLHPPGSPGQRPAPPRAPARDPSTWCPARGHRRRAQAGWSGHRARHCAATAPAAPDPPPALELPGALARTRGRRTGRPSRRRRGRRPSRCRDPPSPPRRRRAPAVAPAAPPEPAGAWRPATPRPRPPGGEGRPAADRRCAARRSGRRLEGEPEIAGHVGQVLLVVRIDSVSGPVGREARYIRPVFR